MTGMPARVNADNRPRTVFMFAGQGSQHPQMGRALYEHNTVFRDWLERLDTMVREAGGESVVEAIYAPHRQSGDALDELSLSHPAIFMVEYALAMAVIDAGVVPDLLLGTSLGSFAAAAVAGFVSAEGALAAVIQQAAALEGCCDEGGMLAILGPVALYDELLAGRCEIAAVNFAMHFVVSAPDRALKSIEADLTARRVAFQWLPVRFAFHSKWIDGAQAPFASFAGGQIIGAPGTPVVCCAEVATLDRLPADFFWRAVRQRIRFPEAIEQLESHAPCHFIDLGPSGTLATLLRHILPPARRTSVRAAMSRFGGDRLDLAGMGASPGT